MIYPTASFPTVTWASSKGLVSGKGFCHPQHGFHCSRWKGVCQTFFIGFIKEIPPERDSDRKQIPLYPTAARHRRSPDG